MNNDSLYIYLINKKKYKKSPISLDHLIQKNDNTMQLIDAQEHASDN